MVVTNDASVQSLSDHEEELPLPFAYKSLAEVADCQPQAVDLPLASSAREGFGKGHFPDSRAGGVHGRKPSLSAVLATSALWCQQQ